MEGVILLKAPDGVPDIFKTLLNSTSFMASVVVVARLTGWRRGAVALAAGSGMAQD